MDEPEDDPPVRANDFDPPLYTIRGESGEEA